MENLPWNDKANAEARLLCQKAREENLMLPWVDENGQVVPPPPHKPLDLSKIGRDV